MASNKLSALSAVSGSLTSDSLVYIADTQDSGSSYSSKKITVANLLSDVASTTDLGTFSGSTIDNNQSIKQAIQALETALETESTARASAISGLVDGAPGLLDTLNELAAAINDDENFVTTITNLIDANETHIDNVATLTGVAKDATGLGTFTGSTISDASDIKTALQDLETAAEAAQAGSAVADRTKTQTDSTDATRYITFVGDDNASATSETVFTDAGITYNPSTNTLVVGNLSVLGTSTQVDTVTMQAANAVVFEGATADDFESTLTVVDPTADRTIKLPNQSGCLPVLAADSTTAVTATPEELNVLDGITATVTELNYVDGVTSNVQTQLDAKTADGDNVNNLVGDTSAGTCPVDGNGDDNYLFLVVNKANGAIVAIDKTFIEAEG